MSELRYFQNKPLPGRPFCYSCIVMEQRFKGFTSLIQRLQNEAARYLEEYAMDNTKYAASEAQGAASVLHEQNRVVRVLDRAFSISVATKRLSDLEGRLRGLLRSVWRVRQIAHSAPYNFYTITSHLEQTCDYLRSIWTCVSPRSHEEYEDRKIIVENFNLSHVAWLPEIRIAADTAACEDCMRVDTSYPGQKSWHHLVHPSQRDIVLSEKQRKTYGDRYRIQASRECSTDLEPERAVPDKFLNSCSVLEKCLNFGPHDGTLHSLTPNDYHEIRLSAFLADIQPDYALSDTRSSSRGNFSDVDTSFLPPPLYSNKTAYRNSKGSSVDWEAEKLEREQEIPEVQNVQRQFPNLDTGTADHRHSEKAEWDYALTTTETLRYKSRSLARCSNMGNSNREVYALGPQLYQHGNVIESLEPSPRYSSA